MHMHKVVLTKGEFREPVPLAKQISTFQGFSIIEMLQGLSSFSMAMVAILSYGMSPAYGTESTWEDIAYYCFKWLIVFYVLLEIINAVQHANTEKGKKEAEFEKLI